MSLRLYDNTRISAYRRCARFFYYRHIRHWRRDNSEAPLVFGGAWHKAQDVIWTGLIDKQPLRQVCDAAYEAFVAEWTEGGMPHPSEMDYTLERELAPRTPGRAHEMIIAYASKRAAQLGSDFELIRVEQPFAVPLDPEDDTLFYVGKIDKIVRRGGRVGGIEHKTTTAYKKDGGFRSAFLDSFIPNAQVDGYLYALHMMFPGKVFGVWVDAALVHRSDEAFTFIPIERHIKQLDAWLWETREWIRRIEHDKARLAETGSQDRYMMAFPKNTDSCFDFSRTCPYIDLCKAWSNPVGKPTPPDMIEDVWDPLKHMDASQLPFDLSQT